MPPPTVDEFPVTVLFVRLTCTPPRTTAWA
jgi:hypothetical protein